MRSNMQKKNGLLGSYSIYVYLLMGLAIILFARFFMLSTQDQKAAAAVSQPSNTLNSVSTDTDNGSASEEEVSWLYSFTQNLAKNYLNPINMFLSQVPVSYGNVVNIELTPEENDTEKEYSGEILFEIEKSAGLLKNDFTLEKSIPSVLIYHTHTEEAYRETEVYTYKSSGGARTKEQDKSVVALGETLKKDLESYGLSALHDTTDNEPPKLSTAYSRSLEAMLKNKSETPSLRLFIDIHRDSAGESQKDDVVVIDGKRCARVMFVVGTGDKYNEKPNYAKNYKLAQLLTAELEGICKGFTRDIRVKSGRYNQHVSDMCILIEVGHNANTFEEARNTMDYIAKAIAKVVT